jgi:hypothetical protein
MYYTLLILATHKKKTFSFGDKCMNNFLLYKIYFIFFIFYRDKTG